MIRHYLLSAARGIRRQPVFTAINGIGLAVGLAGFLLMAQSAAVKLHADKFHPHGDRLFSAVLEIQKQEGESVHKGIFPVPLAEQVAASVPGLEQTVRMQPRSGTLLRHEDLFFEETGLFGVDAGFFDLFGFHLAHGDEKTALKEPSIVLTQELAQKYFGQDNPVGQTLLIDETLELPVTGVLAPLPRTSSLLFRGLISWPAVESLAQDRPSGGPLVAGLFVRLAPSVRAEDVTAPLTASLQCRWNDPARKLLSAYLFPFLDYRLRGEHIETFVSRSAPWAVGLGFGLGLVLLLIASTNFINLSMARMLTRVREVGIRKAAGGKRCQVVAQLLTESMFLAFASVPLAALLYEAGLRLMPSPHAMDRASRSLLQFPLLWVYLLAAAALTGLVSGLPPALALSRLAPRRALAGLSMAGARKHVSRKALIAVQFTLAVLFIAAASVLGSQFKVFRNADLGYRRANVATVALGRMVREDYQRLRDQVGGMSGVESVTGSANLPGLWEAVQSIRLVEQSEEQAVKAHLYAVDRGFPETLDIPLLCGEGFPAEEDGGPVVLVNETLAARLGGDVLGRSLWMMGRSARIAGVTRDFIFCDIGFEMPPAALVLSRQTPAYLLVRLKPGVSESAFHQTLAGLWTTQFPHKPYQGDSLSENLDRFFRIALSFSDFVQLVGFCAVLLSVTGLLGLTGFMVVRRRREIGVRRVLGASPIRVFWTLSREFMTLVAVGEVLAVVAVQLGWEALRRTGMLFYQTIPAPVYLLAFGLPLAMAAAAIYLQARKMIATRPSEALRHE